MRLVFPVLALLVAGEALAQGVPAPRHPPRDPHHRPGVQVEGPVVVIEAGRRDARCDRPARYGSASAVTVDGSTFAAPGSPADHCPAR